MDLEITRDWGGLICVPIGKGGSGWDLVHERGTVCQAHINDKKVITGWDLYYPGTESLWELYYTFFAAHAMNDLLPQNRKPRSGIVDLTVPQPLFLTRMNYIRLLFRSSLICCYCMGKRLSKNAIASF